MIEADFNRSANSDVYLGYVGWAAGSFSSTYGKQFGFCELCAPFLI